MPSDRTYRAVNTLGRVGLRALGVTVRTAGLEHLPGSGPVVLAANHVSYLDFVVLEKAAAERGRYVRFLTRYDAWRPGPLGWALTRMGHVPVDRAVPVEAYLRARRLLRVERDFDANEDLAALVVDMADEIRRLRARMRVLGID